MKKFLVSGLLAISSVVAFAAIDTYEGIAYKQISGPKIFAIGQNTNAAVNIRAAEGIATFVATITGGATNGNATAVGLVLQHSADGSTSWATVTNYNVVLLSTNVGPLVSIKLDSNSLRPFVRTIVNVTNDAVGCSTLMTYHARP